MEQKPRKITIKKWALIGIGLFVFTMFILPFSYFLVTGEFPESYFIQVGKKEGGTKYVCPDGTVVSSPELCPEEGITQPPTKTAVPNQTSIKGDIALMLDGVQDDVKNYLISWYDEFYPILENITGGPCQPFKLRVIYSSAGGGGRFEGSGLGGDANLIFNMELDKTKPYDANFDSRFGHEFSHGFANGIREVAVAPGGGYVTASIISEGSTEMIISSALYELVKKGKTDYMGIHFYLPYVIASYDSYAAQGKNIAGGALMWKAESTGYYYMQAEAVWYLLEQARPGFVKQFFEEACSLPQTKAGGWTGIYLTYDKFKNIIQKIFADTKVEGKNVLEWFDAQPITDINGSSGNYIRIQFRDNDMNKESRSINPRSILMTAVQRTYDSKEGAKDSAVALSPSVKITDWQSKTTELTAKAGTTYSPASAILPALSSGAYKVEAMDSSLNAKTTTHFIITDRVDEDSLYGIKLENGRIIASGTVKTSLDDVQINNGFFALKVPADIKEVNFPGMGRTVIKPVRMARMVILQ